MLKLSVLVAEDNEIQRESIVQLIHDLGFDLTVHTAANGKEAVSVLSGTAIDILLTDIEMPFMDGLKLASYASDKNPDLYTIIFTIFDEFSYAQQALRIGVSRYLLKPLVVSDFVEALNEAIQTCKIKYAENARLRHLESLDQMNTLAAHEKVLIDCIYGYPISNEKRSFLMQTPLFASSAPKKLWLLELSQEVSPSFENRILSLLSGTASVYINLNPHQSLILTENNANPMADQFLSCYHDCCAGRIFISISQPFTSIEELRPRFIQADNLIENRFFYNDSTIFICDEFPAQSPGLHSSPEVRTIIQKISHLASSNSYSAILKCIDDLFMTKANQFPIFMLQYTAVRILEILSISCPKEEFSSQVSTIYRLPNVSVIRDFLSDQVMLLQQQSENSFDNNVINQVIHLIHEHFSEDIGLEWLADQMEFSQSYLSAYFKRETGTTLIRYLTQFRIEYAKHLLRTTDLKIYDVSLRSGFSNDSYFCNLFKKYTGVTPVQYKEGDALL